MHGNFLFTGTGGSMGVPVIGCHCEACRSSSPYNKRLRSSGLLKVNGKTFLLDVGPDFREQALRYHIEHLDGLLITHPHFDHIGGLDDLRVYSFIQKHPLPCLLSQETFNDVKLRFHYLMRPGGAGRRVCAQIDFEVLEGDFGCREFQGISIEYVSYFQTDTKVTGFRVGGFAYISDIREYTDEVFKRLEGVEVLVLSALRQTPTLMHFSLEEALTFAKQVGARKTYLTHIAHELEHETINSILPSDVHLSYDGLEISF